uniref:Alternative protein ATP11A n=1 Tax=Homo sapiens TaxID=9606 RepID=L8EAS3_HUMAN|nr:alternative protein ATP11A [Homo sapiens]
MGACTQDHSHMYMYPPQTCKLLHTCMHTNVYTSVSSYTHTHTHVYMHQSMCDLQTCRTCTCTHTTDTRVHAPTQYICTYHEQRKFLHTDV